MIDASGSWPSFLKDLGAGIARGAEMLFRLVTSPLKATTASIGGGVGYGIKTSANLGGIPAEIGATSSVSDSLVFEEGSFDIKNTSSVSFGMDVAEIFDTYHTRGKEHSYFDSQCTCDFLHSSFGEKSNCPANKVVSNTGSSISLSAGAYLVFGFEASISFDFAAWGEELIDIYHDYS